MLCDADDGRVVGAGSSPHPPTFPPLSEQDPESWWTALTLAMSAALDSAHASGRDVAAISVAAQCHGLIALDADDTVIRPAKLWNDTTSAPEMEELRATISAEEWAQRTGSVPTAAFTVSKLLWLHRHEPQNAARLRTVLLPHDWLTWRLTGDKVTDRSEASGTGYFDATTGRYDEGILELIDADREWLTALPRVHGPQQAAGTLTSAAAAALGLHPGIVIGPGAGDQHASALGLGVRSGDVAYSFGTSGVVFTSTETPVHDPTGIVDGVANASGGFLPLSSTLNAARVTDTFGRLLGVDHAEFSRLALAAEVGGTPSFAAYLDGERKPNLPDARGVLSGITSSTSREQIARAAVEGVVFGLVRGERALTALGVPTDGIRIATGGGARSRAYLQVLADATGRPVHTSPSVESVAVGAAMQASACSTGRLLATVVSDWAPTPVRVLDPQHVVETEEGFDRYLVTASWRGGDRS
ncbi:xylulokinase [Rathayibacter sp. ZW T2_19]|uniref:Xylulose kinase n=1 Tax=Rathayibacter rubneri TaxID=2950106 RepID=A0A9X2DXX7_9MICO|nr:xylulokinase [Rathayibacter rubneri]